MAKGHSGLFSGTKGDKIATGTNPVLQKESILREMIKLHST